MSRPATLLPIVLALGVVVLAPWAGAQAQAGREEGPTEIEKCQTISQPGSYKLVRNLTFTGITGVCLEVTTEFVAIDLAGFTISGPGGRLESRIGIAAADGVGRTTVRNGSIQGFTAGGVILGDSAIVEGVRVSFTGVGIRISSGIVRGNFVEVLLNGEGIVGGTVTVTGNFVTGSVVTGIFVGPGSSVIDNVSTNNSVIGINVTCPSNVTNNTAVGNGINLELDGNGCNNTNNVAP
jgi:hypothetical protein